MITVELKDAADDYHLCVQVSIGELMKDRAFRLGCDIGGTFTDFVLVNDETGTFSIYKCLTTPSDPSDAVETGIRGLENKPPASCRK